MPDRLDLPRLKDEWQKVALGELVEIYDGPHATPKKTASGPVFLGISNLDNGRLDLTQTNHLSEEDFEHWTRRVIPRKDDIVFSYETRIGEAAQIPPNLRCCLGRRLGLLRPKTDKIDARFLLYAFLGTRFQETLQSRINLGSTVDRILLTEMGSFPIEVPRRNIDTQRAIAHILGTLDDKIELNRRMNETLEEMARALFKSWFVDFDPVRAKMEGRDSGLPKHLADLFPDRLVDSELGPIPEGWKVKALGELIELAYGKALKADNRKGGIIPVYGSNGQVGWHDERLVAGPGIVVGRKGNPGVVTWTQSDFFPIDTTFYVVPIKDSKSLPFLFFALTTQDLPSIAADSAVPGLNRNLAYMNRQIVPDKMVMNEFINYANIIFTRRHGLEAESRTLAAQRDALLPKLVSGDLRVNDVEIHYKETY